MGLADFSGLWGGRKTGWVPRPAEVDRVLGSLPFPDLASSNGAIRDSGKGKVVLLHEALAKVRPGGFPVLSQAIGDCVSFGFAGASMTLLAVQIAMHGRAERWPGDVATEPIYGGSRVEVGGGRLWGDGSIGAWAAKWVNEWGLLLRQQYPGLDLTTYSGSRAKDLGRKGVPDGLEPEARLHPVGTVSLCTSYEQARDAIANGYPVPVCSMRGFASRRDTKGFARAQGRWPHCMYFCAVDDADPRPGLLCMNSWGASWISGPKRHNQPEGSFWVDADVCDQMLRQEDSFALSAATGWPAAPTPLDGIDWSKLWTLRAPQVGRPRY